jgi:ferredoxin-NADP reductase
VAGAALLGRLTWQIATVVELVDETAQVRGIVLDLPAWPGHRAGQHVDVRLTAEDGYQAQRSYSIASAPEDAYVALTVERLEDGEVSPYLADELRQGDAVELRGPIGGYFVWEQSLGGPLFLVAGGSGIVPLRAMLRHRSAVGSDVPVRLLYSARSLDVRFTLTRAWPEEWSGHRGRVDVELLEEVAWPPAERPLVYVCGPTGFVEAAAGGLVTLGHDAMKIRTERFGPSGA